jgi:uncharacterized protein YdeI (YjbR/CyaY-like superfamily)
MAAQRFEAVLEAENERARAAFDALSYTHRKEYATWVAEAKGLETRRRRATRAVAMLFEGRGHP